MACMFRLTGPPPHVQLPVHSTCSSKPGLTTLPSEVNFNVRGPVLEITFKDPVPS